MKSDLELSFEFADVFNEITSDLQKKKKSSDFSLMAEIKTLTFQSDD